jgi:hypothetical protein
MIRTKTASLTHKLLLCLALMTAAAVLPSAIAAGAEGTITYQHESFQSYGKQLAGGQIKAVTINKRLRSLHVSLKDGSHVLAKYAAHEEPKVVSALEAKGVTPTIESKAQALKEATKPVKHKLRYIAGGILVVVVIVVGAVLLIDRRRKHEQE